MIVELTRVSVYCSSLMRNLLSWFLIKFDACFYLLHLGLWTQSFMSLTHSGILIHKMIATAIVMQTFTVRSCISICSRFPTEACPVATEKMIAASAIIASPASILFMVVSFFCLGLTSTCLLSLIYTNFGLKQAYMREKLLRSNRERTANQKPWKHRRRNLGKNSQKKTFAYIQIFFTQICGQNILCANIVMRSESVPRCRLCSA